MTNGMLSKQHWLDAAEVVDAWRLFPRAFMTLFAYFAWDMYIWYKVVATTPDFFANLVFGVIGLVFGLYTNSGRKWGG